MFTENLAKRLVSFLLALLALVVIILGEAPLGFVGAFILGVLLGIASDYALYGKVAWAASPRDMLFGGILATALLLVIFLWQPVWLTSTLSDLKREPAFLGFALTVILLGRPRRLRLDRGTQNS